MLSPRCLFSVCGEREREVERKREAEVICKEKYISRIREREVERKRKESKHYVCNH